MSIINKCKICGIELTNNIEFETKYRCKPCHIQKRKNQAKEKVKRYRENNKDKVKEIKKIYYENNKEEILEKYNRKYKDKMFTCECGKTGLLKNKARHLKSKAHNN